MSDKKSKDWWIKFVAWCIFGLSWIVVIGLKIAKEDMSLKIPITISIILTIASLFAIFGKTVANKLKNNSDIPEPLTEEQVEQLVKEQVQKQWNNIKVQKGIEWTKSRTVNKNIIYAMKVNLDLNNESFIIIINANYPNLKPTILPSDTSDYIVHKEMNYKSLTPEAEPDTEERIERDLTTGKEVVYKKEIAKKEEKEGDTV